MPREDHYATLGIDPAASKEEVRRAYRKKAKEAHPDAGGDPAAFHALSRALRILDDPAKRAKYDAGEEPDDTVDNTRARMLVSIGRLFAMVFDGLEERGGDPTKNDIMDLARGTVKGTITRKDVERRKIEKGIAAREKLKGRFSGPPETVAILEAMIDTPIRDGREALAKLNESIAEDREVLAFLEGVTWRHEKPQPRQYTRHDRLDDLPPDFFPPQPDADVFDTLTAEMLKQMRVRAGFK